MSYTETFRREVIRHVVRGWTEGTAAYAQSVAQVHVVYEKNTRDGEPMPSTGNGVRHIVTIEPSHSEGWIRTEDWPLLNAAVQEAIAESLSGQ